MAKDLQETHDYEGCEAWHCGGCQYEKYSENYMCSSIKQAEKLTAKGYRKASEVAMGIFEEIRKNPRFSIGGDSSYSFGYLTAICTMYNLFKSAESEGEDEE